MLNLSLVELTGSECPGSVRCGDWITTYGGRRLYVTDLKVVDVDIVDIAHALGNQCRWGGHCGSFYSVAEHSVLVSELVPPELALCGLLHDASEAYLVDLPRPIKHLPQFRPFVDLEESIHAVISTRFGVPYPHPTMIKEVDLQVALAEAIVLMGIKVDDPAWAHLALHTAPTLRFRRLAPDVATYRFMKRYYELTRTPTNPLS